MKAAKEMTRLPSQFLQAALNGDRIHPAAPRTPEAIAESALAAIRAGAQSVHVHAFDDNGQESLDGAICARVLRAIRAVCVVPVSLTTSATIVSNATKRLHIISEWQELPDLVTANQGEGGIAELCAMLHTRGVQIEAGLLSVEDAQVFVSSGLSNLCRRVLIEPLHEDVPVALAQAAQMEQIVTSAGISLEQVHHGYGIACWAVIRRALQRGHGIRIGLEDVTQLPDRADAQDNAHLVRIASGYMQEALSGLRNTQ